MSAYWETRGVLEWLSFLRGVSKAYLWFHTLPLIFTIYPYVSPTKTPLFPNLHRLKSRKMNKIKNNTIENRPFETRKKTHV